MNNTKNIIIGGKSVLRVMIVGKVLWNSYDDTTKAVLRYADDNGYQKPSEEYILKLDNFIKQLKSYNLWDKMDLAYWMVGDSDMNFKCINIVDPSKFKGTPIGGLISTLQGIEGNGVDGYIDTGFNPSGSGQKFKLIDAHSMVYASNSPAPSSFRIIYSISASSLIMRIYNGAQAFNSQTQFTGGLAGAGFKLLSRKNNLEVEVSNNEVLNTVSSAVASSHPDATLNLFSNPTASAFYSGINAGVFSLGAAISGQDAINYRQAIINNLQYESI